MYTLPRWVLTNSKPGFYDTESATAIEQTAKLYKAMQDLIDEYNSFAEKSNKIITDFIEGTQKDYEAFQVALRQEFQDFIDTIELKCLDQDRKISELNKVIDDAVGYMKDNLGAYVTITINEMRENGELTDAIMDALDDFTQKLNNLEAYINEKYDDLTDIIHGVENKIIYATPEMYGAIGDGITDDSDAIIEALNQNTYVVFKGTYLVSKEIYGTASNVIGIGAVITLSSDIDKIFVLPNASKVEGFIFDCAGHGVGQCIQSTAANVEISNIEIFDVTDMRSDSGSELIVCSENGNVHIHDIHIFNCTHIINGVIGDTEGNISGIYVHNHNGICVIENVKVREIHNVDANGNLILEDGNGIYVHCLNKEADTYIQKITGYNYSKRLIKTQCSGNVFMDSVHSYSNAKDHLLAIGIQNTEHESQKDYGYAIISNCVLVNDYVSGIQEQYLISSGERVKIVNCKLVSKTQMSIYNIGDMDIYGCSIEGYGIQQEGRTLNIDNVSFKGKSFITSFHNNENNVFLIKNSIIQDSEYSGVAYSDFELIGKSVDLNNVKILNKQLSIEADGRLYNVQILDSTNTERLLIRGNLDLKDVLVKARENTNHVTAINILGDSNVILENITTEGFDINIILNGNIKINGGVDIMKLFKDNLTSIKNVPEYYDELHWSSTIPNGVLALHTVDNKLYERQGTEWIPRE